jgi:hypothetical protein
MFYFPFSFVVGVQRVGCTRVVCQMNEEWSSQMGTNELVLDHTNPSDAEGVYQNIKKEIS